MSQCAPENPENPGMAPAPRLAAGARAIACGPLAGAGQSGVRARQAGPLGMGVRRLIPMGHSFVEVADRGVWVNDGHLTLLQHFIEREGRGLLAERGADANLNRSFERFLEGFADYGPG